MSRSSSEAFKMLAIIGRKIGMTQLFNEEGMRVPVSVVQVEPNTVILERTRDKHGYSAMVLAAEPLKKSRIRKPYAGQFPKDTTATRFLMEFKDFERECKVGDKLGVEVFEGVRFVDVRGTTKGKGFQGVVRRHKFQGGPGAHGSKFHREMGSVGTGAFRKIVKGSKMPGHMGAERLTVQNLRLFKVDAEKKLLLIRGAIPGRQGGMVVVQKAVKK
jgi:large subunit ribosomal protein L3